MNATSDESIDGDLCTFEGNRRRQHLHFLALPFRRKLELLEELAEVSARFTAIQTAGGRHGAPSDR